MWLCVAEVAVVGIGEAARAGRREALRKKSILLNNQLHAQGAPRACQYHLYRHPGHVPGGRRVSVPTAGRGTSSAVAPEEHPGTGPVPIVARVREAIDVAQYDPDNVFRRGANAKPAVRAR